MKFEGNRKLALTLIALGIIFSFFGGSLAYLGWRTSDEQRTYVTMEFGPSKLTIEGGNVEKNGMYHTQYCDGDGAAIGDVATATAVNESNLAMEVILKIRASLTLSQGTLNAEKKVR